MLGNEHSGDQALLIEAVAGWRAWIHAGFMHLNYAGQLMSPDMMVTWRGGQLEAAGGCHCGSEECKAALELLQVMTAPQLLAKVPSDSFVRRHYHNLLEADLCGPADTNDPALNHDLERELRQRLTELSVCRCGINAWATAEQLADSPYAGHLALGRVELTGHVRQFDSGWRGEKARITHLWANPAPVKPPNRTTSIEHQVRAVSRICERDGIAFMGMWPGGSEAQAQLDALK